MVEVVRLQPVSQGSNPRGADFQLEVRSFVCVEKSSLTRSTRKHKSKAGLVSHELQCRYVWVGQEFGCCLDLCEKFFFLNTMSGAVLYPVDLVFYSISIYSKHMNLKPVKKTFQIGP